MWWPAAGRLEGGSDFSRGHLVIVATKKFHYVEHAISASGATDAFPFSHRGFSLLSLRYRVGTPIDNTCIFAFNVLQTVQLSYIKDKRE